MMWKEGKGGEEEGVQATEPVLREDGMNSTGQQPHKNRRQCYLKSCIKGRAIEGKEKGKEEGVQATELAWGESGMTGMTRST